MKKLRKAKAAAVEVDGVLEKPATVKTHMRNMTIVPEMVGCVCGVYSGKHYVTVEVKVRFLKLVPLRLRCFGTFCRVLLSRVVVCVGTSPPFVPAGVLEHCHSHASFALSLCAARYDRSLPRRVLHHLQARLPRPPRSRRHQLFPLHPAQVKCLNDCGLTWSQPRPCRSVQPFNIEFSNEMSPVVLHPMPRGRALLLLVLLGCGLLRHTSMPARVDGSFVCACTRVSSCRPRHSTAVPFNSTLAKWMRARAHNSCCRLFCDHATCGQCKCRAATVFALLLCTTDLQGLSRRRLSGPIVACPGAVIHTSHITVDPRSFCACVRTAKESFSQN